MAALRRLLAVLALAAGCALALAPVAQAKGTPDALPTVAVAELPREAATVLAQVRAGGPFRYDRDGIVFGNRERILPAKPKGYYREYTVPTPGVKTRGARRIVCGGAPTTPDACFYSDDHYQSFRRIRE
jgi:ribonuclease T1